MQASTFNWWAQEEYEVEDLFDAVRNGNRALLRKVLDAGVPVESKEDKKTKLTPRGSEE